MKDEHSVQHVVPAVSVTGKEAGGSCERAVPAEVADLGAALRIIGEVRKNLSMGQNPAYQVLGLAVDSIWIARTLIRKSATGGNDGSERRGETKL